MEMSKGLGQAKFAYKFRRKEQAEQALDFNPEDPWASMENPHGLVFWFQSLQKQYITQMVITFSKSQSSSFSHLNSFFFCQLWPCPLSCQITTHDLRKQNDLGRLSRLKINTQRPFPHFQGTCTKEISQSSLPQCLALSVFRPQLSSFLTLTKLAAISGIYHTDIWMVTHFPRSMIHITNTDRM